MRDMFVQSVRMFLSYNGIKKHGNINSHVRFAVDNKTF